MTGDSPDLRETRSPVLESRNIDESNSLSSSAPQSTNNPSNPPSIQSSTSNLTPTPVANTLLNSTSLSSGSSWTPTPSNITNRSSVTLSPPSFHAKKGQLVTLTQTYKTATRNHATQEFNHGLVLSSFPLQDNQIFEVKIDKKINSWSGSIEVGVTCCDPNTIETPFPSSATELREGTWIMSGNSVLKDGRSINENYGTDLDKLEEGDRVGVLRTGLGDLIFFVNGVSQGIAASNLPSRVFAVVDMYGKCAQVTIMDNTVQEARIHTNDLNNVATAAAAASIHLNTITSNNSHNNITNANIQAATAAASAAVAAATSSGIAAASTSGLIRENINSFMGLIS